MPTIVFAASHDSALTVKLLSARGKAFSVKTAATHDQGTHAAPHHLIDASFLGRLPDGRMLRESLVSPKDGEAADEGQRIVGVLSVPLRIAVKTVPKEITVPETEKFPLVMVLNNVIVVEKLPVPLHVSVKALQLEGLVPESAPPFQSILDVCGSPGLDGIVVERSLFPSTYHKHEFWQRDPTLEDAASDEKPASSSQHAASCEVFTPASAFEGGRPGFVFKNGSSGLGYYLDSPPTPDPAVLASAMQVDASPLPMLMGAAVVVVAIAAAVLVRRMS